MGVRDFGRIVYGCVGVSTVPGPWPRRIRVELLIAHADGGRGREALASLDFYVHADLFMNPTADLADIVLPVASAFEIEALRVGFEVSEGAQSLVQLRTPVVAPRGEARSDIQIIFDLATHLGLGHHFWNGDIDAAYRHQLEPSGISLKQLRAARQVRSGPRWQACAEIGAPGYDPFGPSGANLNLIIRHQPSDPISGSVPHREYICNISLL